MRRRADGPGPRATHLADTGDWATYAKTRDDYPITGGALGELVVIARPGKLSGGLRRASGARTA